MKAEKMTKIDKLISELCPDGVEFKGLGEVCEIANNKRKPVESSLRVLGKIPYYGANNVQDYVEGFTHDGDYILIAEDGSASLDNYSIQHATGKFWANNHVHVIAGSGGLNNRFLFHYLKNANFIPFLSGGTRAKLTKAKMVQVKIPIPPLPIQEEIVKILDTFTKLETELETKLEAELETRKKQYEYYRDELLTFGGEVEFKELEEVILSLKTGLNPRKNFKLNTSDAKNYYVTVRELNGKGITIYDKTDKINDEGLRLINNRSNLEKGDILFSGTGTIGRTALVSETPINWNVKEGVYIIKPIQKLIQPIFLLYYLNTSFSEVQVETKKVGSPVCSVPMSELKKIKIPLPPLQEQERIVAILDKFDALVNDISVGLPAELSARRKQYEYYREKLLTFKEVEE